MFHTTDRSIEAGLTTATAVPARRSPRRHRFAGLALVIGLGLAAATMTPNPAAATVRLPNGAFGSYGLDCSGWHNAKLTVQGGANGIPVTGFKYWIYSVDYGRYILNGAYVPNGNGWNSTTISIVRTPGRYQVYVEYWSNTGGRWYAGGEWTWAKNLVQPTSSQTCRVL